MGYEKNAGAAAANRQVGEAQSLRGCRADGRLEGSEHDGRVWALPPNDAESCAGRRMQELQQQPAKADKGRWDATVTF